MSDEAEVEVEDQNPIEEIEIAVGAEPEAKKPEVVTLSPAEFAALKAQGDSAAAIQKGIEGLGSRLSSPAQAQQPANAPTQTPEEFYAEHADDMFDKEKAPKVMAQYNKMLMEREYGPMFNAQAQALVATKKELLKSKEPLFSKYEAEVENLVRSQPANAQLAPDIYDRAWLAIRQQHQAEIEEDSVKSKIDEAVNARLKELGIDLAKVKSGERPPAYVNSESRSQQASGSTKRTIRLPDEATRAKYEREALRRGMDLADLLRTKGL